MALIACACAREITPEPVFNGRTIRVSIEDPQTKAFLCPQTKASMSANGSLKTVLWTKEDVFNIYKVSDAGSCRQVHPISINESGSQVVLPVPFTEEELSIVVTFGGATYAGDSVVLAKAPIKQDLFTNGYNADILPLSTSIINLNAENPNPVLALHPLTALVEMDIVNLPGSGEKIRSINMSTTMERGTKGYMIAAGEYCHYLKVGSLEHGTTLFDIYEGSEYANEIHLTSDELIAHNGSLSAYFLAAHFNQGDEINTYIKQMDVTVLTDKSVIKKSFDTSAAKLRTTCGRASRFSLDFSKATVEERTGFSVIWSKGYVNYDSTNHCYGFAEPEDHGLYFKPGSVIGMDMFPSMDPDTLFKSTRYLVSYRWDTVNNINDETYYNIVPWEVGAADLKAYKPDASGSVQPFAMSSYDDANDFVRPADMSYKAAKDPCTYVKEGGYKWRMATVDDYQELINASQESISNWTLFTRGETTLDSNLSRPRALRITDKEGQSVTFASTSSVSHTNSLSTSGRYAGYRTYYVSLGSSLSVYAQTPTMQKKESTTYGDYVINTVFNIGTFTNSRAESEQELKLFASTSVYSDHQGATAVRCVRSK